jgi:hypothetical protein
MFLKIGKNENIVGSVASLYLSAPISGALHKERERGPCKPNQRISRSRYLEPVCEIADAGAVAIGMAYDDYLVPTVDETLRELVDV